MLYYVSVLELNKDQLNPIPKNNFYNSIEESLIKQGQDIWQVLWKMYLEDIKIKLFVYGLDEVGKVNFIKTICLDESMFSMFDIFQENDEMDYKWIIDVNVKEDGYSYNDCDEGEVITDIKDIYVF